MNTFRELFDWDIEIAKKKYDADYDAALSNSDSEAESKEKEQAAKDAFLSTYLKWAHKVSTFGDARYVYTYCHPQSEAARVTYRRWLRLCTCAREARLAYLASCEEDEESGKEKWLSFFPHAKNLQDPILLSTTAKESDAYALAVMNFGSPEEQEEYRRSPK